MAGLTVRADAVRLRQAVVNLLSNAIKYNQSGGWARLTVARDQGKVRIQVQDNGPGIPIDKQQRLFRAFDRLGAEFGVIEGSGIGLAITRRLVQAMGGEIGFWSRPGQGSLFWIELAADAPVPDVDCAPHPAAPAASPSQPLIVPEIPVPAAVTRIKVMAVEDNPVNMLLVRLALGKRPEVQFREAISAEQALEMVQQEVPDLILMDINLPCMDGYQALSALRADPRACKAHIVALTASAMKEDREEGLAAGFDEYLTKPVNLKDLNELIDRISRKGGT
jgi:CheY-like chemotaxis protein